MPFPPGKEKRVRLFTRHKICCCFLSSGGTNLNEGLTRALEVATDPKSAAQGAQVIYV